MIYLDNAATSKPSAASLEAFLKASEECYGNSVSSHFFGKAAEKMLSVSRRTIADALSANPDEITFVSSGTEGNNLALKSAAKVYSKRKKHIVSTDTEHASVLETLRFFESEGFSVSYIAPERDGHVSPEKILEACREDTFLVSVCAVCSETGAVMPVREIAAAVKNAYPGILIHCDAVQGFLRTDIRSEEDGLDYCVVSGHKVSAPKGVAALWTRDGVRLSPQMHGGGHENNMRSGTVNVPLCAAFAEAVRSFRPVGAEIMPYALKRLGEKANIKIIPPHDSGHILSFAVLDRPGEVTVRILSDRGICVSTGAACKKNAKSRALMAQKLPPEVVSGAVRISFSCETTTDDIDALADAL